jgi:hypothetical protein
MARMILVLVIEGAKEMHIQIRAKPACLKNPIPADPQTMLQQAIQPAGLKGPHA